MSKEKIETLKEYIIRLFQGRLFFESFHALKNITFDVYKGDVLGIIGVNGSGKSTLLKIISSIITPTEGTVEVDGKIGPLIELGAGFDYELTGRENIYLNGSVLGFTEKEMDEYFDDIVNFAELRDFIDVPLKNFSSGMISRIAFAVATITKPDILIVDEILSVGDIFFQQKSEEKINELMNNNTTVLIVSHALDQIERLCDKVIWLDKGEIIEYGSTKAILEKYKNQ